MRVTRKARSLYADILFPKTSRWERCATINLCVRLGEVHPPSKEAFNATQMRAQKERYGMNLIMCWEQASGIGPFSSLSVAKAFVQMWRDLRSAERFREIDTARLIAWMLPKIQHPFMEWLPRDCNEQHIDVTADVIVGGPREDFLELADINLGEQDQVD